MDSRKSKKTRSYGEVPGASRETYGPSQGRPLLQERVKSAPLVAQITPQQQSKRGQTPRNRLDSSPKETGDITPADRSLPSQLVSTPRSEAIPPGGKELVSLPFPVRDSYLICQR